MASATDTLKPEEKKEEFDLDNVNVDELPEGVREVAKRLQADYTKKTQKLSEKEKELGDKVKRGEEWDQWYDRNKDTLANYNEYAQKLAQGGAVHRDNINPNPEPDPEPDPDDELLDDGTRKLKQDLSSVKSQQQKDRQELEGTMSSMADMMVDLVEAVQDTDYDFKISHKKVIQYAQKKGITDMKEAIQGAYQREIIDSEIETRVKEEVEKEKEKLKLNVVNDTIPKGRVPRKVVKKRGE